MDYSRLWIWWTVAFLTSCQLHVSYGSPPRRRRQNSGSRVIVYPESNVTDHHSLPVFPGPVVDYVGRQAPLAPPVDKFGQPICASTSDTTFCEKVDNYPDEEIRRVIQYSSEEFKDLFGTLSINARKVTPGDLSEQSICPQQTRMFYPKAAVNENDQWAYVVNDVDYVQAVMSEMCEKENKPCKYLDGDLPAGVTSRCKQKYAYKRLLALHPNNKKTYADAFRFPSCCVCYVTKPFVLSSRTAKVGEQARQQKPKEQQ